MSDSAAPVPAAIWLQPQPPAQLPRRGTSGRDPSPAAHCSQGPGTGDHAAAREAWLALVASGLLGERGRIRVSRDGGASYPARHEHPVAARPTEPAACFVYDDRGRGRVLVADFDAKRHQPWQAAADAAGFRLLIERCGGTSIEDLSPAGGRHVYVPFTAPLPFALLRRAAEALHLRMTGPLWHGTFDKSPMMNATDGLIRPPGSAHPAGGYQTLVTPLAEARRTATRRNGRHVWDALLADLAPEFEKIMAGAAPAAGNDTTIPCGPHRNLAASYQAIARTGRFDPARYPSRSEARLAVLRAARSCGWNDLDEVIAQARPAGPWPGLGLLFAKYSSPATRRRQWERDWAKATLPLPNKATSVGGTRNGRHNFPTRQEDTPPELPPAQSRTGVGQGAQAAPDEASLREISAAQVREWGFIRCAVQAVYMAEACGRWDDRAGLSVRLVLRAAGRAAMLRGSRYIAFGTRFLGLDSLLDRTTVGHALRRLRGEDDPFLVLVEGGRGIHGDLYEWRIPDQFAHVAAFTNPLAGKIDAIHPVFRSLGVPAALVYEALDAVDAMPAELARSTRLSASAQRGALRVLEQVGLAERAERGWRRGRADLNALARSFGADQVHRDIARRWATERAAWQSVCSARPALGVLDVLADWEHEHDDDLEAWSRAVEQAGPPPPDHDEPAPASSPIPSQRALEPTPRLEVTVAPQAAAPLTAAAVRNKTSFDVLPNLHRAVLCALFRADQAAERQEKAREAAGENSRKASQWRTLDLTSADSALAAALPALADQPRIDEAIDALERAGLLESHREDALFGVRVTVRINRRARTLARAGLGIPQGRKRPPGLLSEGLWRCLEQVAAAEPEGLPHERLWDKAPLHLAEGRYHRPGKRFIELGYDGRWHLTPAGDEHVARYLEAYLNLCDIH